MDRRKSFRRGRGRGRGGPKRPRAFSGGPRGNPKRRRTININRPTIPKAPPLESDVGITSFLSSHRGIEGEFKQRYADFQVNEIMPGGRVVRLENVCMAGPKKPKQKKPSSQTWEDLSAMLDMPAAIAALAAIVGNDDAKRVEEWLRTDASARTADLVMEANADAKEKRTEFHNAVRQHLRGAFSSRAEYRSDETKSNQTDAGAAAGGGGAAGESAPSSAEAPSSSSTSATPTEVQTDRRRLIISTKKDAQTGYRSGPQWPRDRPPWTEFTLFKIDHDTIHAAAALRRVLRSGGHIAYAGTKDRRAATSQRMAIRRLDPERLAHINRALPGIRVGDVKFVNDDEQPTMGRLDGNRFVVVLREAKPISIGASSSESSQKAMDSGDGDGAASGAGEGASSDAAPAAPVDLAAVEAELNSSMEAWKATGHRFINYYGMQRFGSGPVGTHVIGQSLLSRSAEDVYTLMLRLPGWVGILEEMGQSAAARLRADGVDSSLATGADENAKQAAAAASSSSEGGDAGAAGGGCRSLSDLRNLWPWLRKATDLAAKPAEAPEHAAAEAASGGGGAAEEDGAAASEDKARDSPKTYGSQGSGGLEEAVALFPTVPGDSHEDNLVRGLLLEDDSVDALVPVGRLQKHLVSLYIHAYQSFVWNRMVTARLTRLASDNAVEGDLVLTGKMRADGVDDDEEEEEEEDDGGRGGRGRGGRGGFKSRGFPEVHVVTAAEAASCTYGINDVVMPLPGVFVQWPQHEVGLREACRLMREDGVLGPFADDTSSKDLQQMVAAAFSKSGTCLGRLGLPRMPGGYRQLVRQAFDVSWRMVPHAASSQKDLVDTDADRLARAGQFPCRGVLGLTGPGSVSQRPAESRKAAGAGEDGPSATGATDVREGSEGKAEVPAAASSSSGDGGEGGEGEAQAPDSIALVLEFSLPKSCYATMMLREVCHKPTHKGSFLAK